MKQSLFQPKFIRKNFDYNVEELYEYASRQHSDDEI